MSCYVVQKKVWSFLSQGPSFLSLVFEGFIAVLFGALVTSESPLDLTKMMTRALAIESIKQDKLLWQVYRISTGYMSERENG